ncbi:ABC transporter permease subunit [Solimonas marina]|nr:ABC transporter permease subunit [Solimonas marina]
MGLIVALSLLLAIILFVLLAPLASPYACDEIDFDGPWSSAPTLAHQHWFGTDSLGRDLFVRTACGGRLSLLVGVVSTLVSLLIGVAYGACAGYAGGRVDTLMMRAVDVLYALPFMFLVIVLMVLFGRHLLLLFVAIGAVNWLDMARVVRGQTLVLRRREFIAAARIGGLSDARIIVRHIVPNLVDIVVVYAALTLPQVILIESFLSFLGLGAASTSWGALVDDGAREMMATPWSLLFPALFLGATLLLLNLVAEQLRLRLARGAGTT